MKMKKIMKFIIIFFILFLLTTNVALATDGSAYLNTQQFDSYATTAQANYKVVDNTINTVLGNVLTVVRTIAFCIAMLMLIILGIQYMTATPEMKGEIKKKQPLYITGAVILFAASGILQIITYFIGDTLSIS